MEEGRDPLHVLEEILAEVKYVDDSGMKLKLFDEKLELVTRHGVLLVAVADVRRIDFANRVPADVAGKVALAVGKLNHAEFTVMESVMTVCSAKGRGFPAG